MFFHKGERVAGMVVGFFLLRFARSGGLGNEFLKFGSAAFAAFEQFLEFAGIILQIHAAEMKHYQRRTHSHGEIERVERVLERQLAIAAECGLGSAAKLCVGFAREYG